jgi:uncharacterized protein
MDNYITHVGLASGVGLLCAVGWRCANLAQRWLKSHSSLTAEYVRSMQEFNNEQEERPVTNESNLQLAWQGYRRFVVAKLVREAEGITSLYLVPEDARPLPMFKPGQFLTVRVAGSNQANPLVRCYSLSDRHHETHYRISVKAVTKNAANSMSSFLNYDLQEHTILEVQAPRGEFYLDTTNDQPIVLIGAGIGITPLLSMLHTVLNSEKKRPVFLFYGIRNGKDHAFKDVIKSLAREHKSFQYIPCYSQPLPTDKAGYDYVVPGRLTAELVRKVVTGSNAAYYMCGPGAFMSQMVSSLQSYGIAESQIHFEAFGPSSIPPKTKAVATTPTVKHKVTFGQSKQTVNAEEGQSLLELGEQQGIALPSGCRSGNCGMCAVRLNSGTVRYQQKPSVQVPTGSCLTCIAEPNDCDIVLDA